MKLLPIILSVLGLITIITSCDKSEEEEMCLGVACEQGVLEGFYGEFCEIETDQHRLDGGETRFGFLNEGFPLDSLYGKMYEGGLIFYLNTANNTGMVAASEDQSESIQWGCTSIDMNGALGSEIGAGTQNTMEILMNCPDVDIAARLCADLVLNDKDDWFLPSIDELNLMWENLADSDGNDFITGPGDPNNLGGFNFFVYWSSTEGDNNFVAMAQFFVEGRQSIESRSIRGAVRAARAF